MESEAPHRTTAATASNRWHDDSVRVLAILWPWCLSAGLLVLTFQPTLIFGPVAALLCLSWLVSKRYAIFKALSLFLFGVLWANGFAHWVLSDQLDPTLQGQELKVIGEVSGVPKRSASYTQFNFIIKQLSASDQLGQSPGKVRLRWYGTSVPEIAPGQQWAFYVKLKRPHGSANPGSFDYAAWLLSKRIRATGYIRKPELAEKLSAGKANTLSQFRHDFAQYLSAQSFEHAGILTALSVGLRSQMSDEDWLILQNTGTTHLVAISGLHIGLVAGLLYFIASFLWRHTLLTRTHYPTQKAAWFVALAGALVYAALAGFAIPTRRAMLMLAAIATLFFLGRRPGPGFSLGLVLALVLLVDPLAPLSTGFWLSFIAVGVILYNAKNQVAGDGEPQNLPWFHALLRNGKRRFIAFSHIQWALFIALAPLLLLYFQKVSLVAFLANFVAIALIGFVIVPLILLAALSYATGLNHLSDVLAGLSDDTLGRFWPYLKQLSELDFAVWQAHLPTWALLMAFMGALLLLSKKWRKWRFAAAIFLGLPLFFTSHPRPQPGEIWLSVLDVGQGLAVVAQTHDHTLVYDTGPKYSGGFDAGAAIVLPALRHMGVDALDAMVISHDNNDHIGGLGAIAAQLPIDTLWASPNEGVEGSQPCLAGKTWRWDAVDFTFLHPKASDPYAGNNASCVLKVSSRYGAILLTGDIENEVELALVNQASDLKAAVLLVPHHGSKSSSTAAFVAAVAPQYALVSAGYLSRFGHPHKTVTQTYDLADAALFNTATLGRIAIKISAAGIQTSAYRQEHKRFWRD